MEKFPTTNPDIGSPEHFEQAKNQHKSDMPADWSGLEEWGKEQGPAPWNEARWQSEPRQSESRQAKPEKAETISSDPALNTLYNHTTKRTPERYSQETKIGQPSTKLLSALAAVLPAGTLIGDMALNGASDFAVQNPAVVVAGIIALAGAAAIGVNKLVNNPETNNLKGDA